MRCEARSERGLLRTVRHAHPPRATPGPGRHQGGGSILPDGRRSGGRVHLDLRNPEIATASFVGRIHSGRSPRVYLHARRCKPEIFRKSDPGKVSSRLGGANSAMRSVSPSWSRPARSGNSLVSAHTSVAKLATIDRVTVDLVFVQPLVQVQAFQQELDH
jgi:hypothetical protein